MWGAASTEGKIVQIKLLAAVRIERHLSRYLQPFFNMRLPVDLRNRYIQAQGESRRRRVLLSTDADYNLYIPYPQSTSIVPGSLQAYWWDSASSTWLIIPDQKVSSDGSIISVNVTRGMISQSDFNFATTAFAEYSTNSSHSQGPSIGDNTTTSPPLNPKNYLTFQIH
jgi:hypothetical protein